MKIGDLVAYVEETIEPDDPSRGIITDGPWDTVAPLTRRYEVVWYTCGNKGWWEEKNLEVVSESR